MGDAEAETLQKHSDEAEAVLSALGSVLTWASRIVTPANPAAGTSAMRQERAEGGTHALQYIVTGPDPRNTLVQVRYTLRHRRIRERSGERGYRLYKDFAEAKQDCEQHEQTGRWQSGLDDPHKE